MAHHMTVTVERHTPTTPYSPMLFGGFLEHFGHQVYGGVYEPGSRLADDRGFRVDVIDAIKELRCPIIRWPGGCYVSGYHWRDGVGKHRKPTDDMAWGVVEPHTFGTDEFINLCRLLECEPYICNNAGNGTIAEMQKWVAYTNAGNAPGYVRYWSIGNENWGKHEIGYKPISEWAPLVARAAERMKEIDPGILLSAASLPTKDWTIPLLREAGDHLAYISVHGYWLMLHQENEMPDYLTCILQSEGPERRIIDAIEGLEESGFRGRVKIAFDEWNLRGWHHPGFPRKEVQDYTDPEVVRLVGAREKNLLPQQYTMADALFSASFLNSCLRHSDDVGMANIAPLVNTRGPLSVHPTGIVKRTHYHTLWMYANLLEAGVVDSVISSGPLNADDSSIGVGDAIVTAGPNKKKWSVAVVNRHPTDELKCRIVRPGKPINGPVNATVLSGGSVDAYNDINHPDRVVPESRKLPFRDGSVRLPAHSLSIFRIHSP